MATSEAQKRANQKYKTKNIDFIAFETRKGKKAEYKAAAAELGLGQMEMIRLAIDEFILSHPLPIFAPTLPPKPPKNHLPRKKSCR